MDTSRLSFWLVRSAAALAVLVVLLYAGAIAFLKFHEAEMLFPRETAPNGLPAPADSLRLPYQHVTFRTADSVTLSSWVVPGAVADPAVAEPASDDGMWVIICHGQTGHLATTVRPEYYAHLRAIGVSLLAFDWRGFGASEGRPTEAGLYRDATAAYEYLRTARGVAPERIIIYGHSLGTAPAVELATRVPAAGLIIEGAPTSVKDRGAEVYPWLPVRWVASVDFNSLARIRTLRMPLLVMHARADETIPIAHGRALFAAAPGPKRFVELGGGHADAFQADSATYFGEYARFVGEVRALRTSSGGNGARLR